MAGGIVTVLGASGHVVEVTVKGAQAFTLAQQYAAAVNSAGSSGDLFATEGGISAAPTSSTASVREILPTAGGSYTYPDGYNYFTTDTGAFVYIDASAATSADTLNTLVGTGGATYVAGDESGTFIAGGGNNNFEGDGNGNYQIATGDGNDNIHAGNGNDTISAGTGTNSITLGDGSNTVISDGTDNIASGIQYNLITLNGSGSQITSGSGGLTVVDNGTGNSIDESTSLSVFDAYSGSTTVYGGDSGHYTLGGNSTVYSGTADTISASGNTTVYGGIGTVVTDTGNGLVGYNPTLRGSGFLQFVGQANAAATVNSGPAAATVTGASGADITYTGLGTLTSAGGNETLDGGGSTQGFAGFVSNQFAATGNTSLIGGSGADTLTAGLGHQTITGGAGANMFVLAENATQGDATVTITDLGSSTTNLVALYGYGANEVANALATVTVAGGSSTITLADHSTVTFLGVTDLKATSFTGDT